MPTGEAAHPAVTSMGIMLGCMVLVHLYLAIPQVDLQTLAPCA